MNLETSLASMLDAMGTNLDQASPEQLFCALLRVTRDVELKQKPAQGDRKLYYFSAEFLIGRLLRANLQNLGLLDDAERILAEHGTSLAEVEDREPEPSLGNGGLGRLAACFLDSIASLGLPGDGVGLNYHFGLFRQDLSQGVQLEKPNPWIEPDSWLIETGSSFTVPFGSGDLSARMFDIQIPGYKNGVCNRLHLFDVIDPAPAPENGIAFDASDVAHRLTSFLYPDDSTEEGRLLRIYQQYFMVSAGAQLILSELAERGHQPSELDRYAAIHINDTHPSMVIPEMIRLLMEDGMPFDQAADVVERTCAYTNHTILAEALETWPMRFIEQVAPGIVPIIRKLDERARSRSNDERVAVIDSSDCVHMAHMDVHFCHAVNGVAALHTHILTSSEMRPFAELYPSKFSNKTNGITFRRWIHGANPALASLLDDVIGTDWRSTGDLSKLAKFADDKDVLERLAATKVEAKAIMRQFMALEQGVTIPSNAIIDVQVKRIHEYKRQQMLALYIIWKYFDIKNGNRPKHPVTIIFGGKAAPAYTIAQDIIHLILTLSQWIANDPDVAPYLQVVMIENYNVTAAERVIPAADISEQISLASKEASGTSNMKFMLNGALTLCTLDGANVEIAELVGDENIYTFGASSKQVEQLYADGTYNAGALYRKPGIKLLVDFITNPAFMATGNAERLQRLHDDIKGKDWFMALLDIEEYIQTKERVLADYEDQDAWMRKALINIANAGTFSSDRTISQYNDEIWHLS